MRPFVYERPMNLAVAAKTAAQLLSRGTGSGFTYLAGGTTLLDLMKLDVMRPAIVVDINRIETTYGQIELDEHGLRLRSNSSVVMSVIDASAR